MSEQNGQAAKKGIDILKSMLSAESVEEQFKNALGKNSSGFITSVISLYNGNTLLQQCEPKQVVMEALKAATLKLPIDPNLGYAWILPYNNSVKQANGGYVKKMTPTFQLGSKGYIQLAMRTGQYRTINADVVYEGEMEKVNKLTGEFTFNGEATSDKVVGYFAYIELLNGFSKTLYLTKDEIERHAKRFSKSYNSNSSPWKSDFDEMALKTIIKRLLSKYGYLSIEMQTAVSDDISGDTMTERDALASAPAVKTINIDEVQTAEEVKEEKLETTEDPY